MVAINSVDLSANYAVPEPKLVFANGNTDTHPLRGLLNYGPYSEPLGLMASTRVAYLAPSKYFSQLDALVNELKRTAQPKEASNVKTAEQIKAEEAANFTKATRQQKKR